jgi:hypothetical protein
MGLIAEQAQRSTLIIPPDTLYTFLHPNDAVVESGHQY